METIFNFIGDYQTLIAGGVAIIAAFIAARPAYKQLKIMRLQSAVATRDTLIKRLADTERRQKEASGLITEITQDFERTIYPNQDINPHWASDAWNTVCEVITRLTTRLDSQADPKSVCLEYGKVIQAANELKDNLDLMTQPYTMPWDDPDNDLDEGQRIKAEREADEDAENARQEVPDNIATVRDAGENLDVAYNAVIGSLRERLRQIDEYVLAQNV